MRLSILFSALLAFISTTALADRGPRTTDHGPLTTAESPIAGTWEGKMDGLPVLTVTIKDEGGALSGAVTFYRIRDEGAGPKVEGKETTPGLSQARRQDLFFSSKRSKR